MRLTLAVISAFWRLVMSIARSAARLDRKISKAIQQ